MSEKENKNKIFLLIWQLFLLTASILFLVKSFMTLSNNNYNFEYLKTFGISLAIFIIFFISFIKARLKEKRLKKCTVPIAEKTDPYSNTLDGPREKVIEGFSKMMNKRLLSYFIVLFVTAFFIPLFFFITAFTNISGTFDSNIIIKSLRSTFSMFTVSSKYSVFYIIFLILFFIAVKRCYNKKIKGISDINMLFDQDLHKETDFLKYFFDRSTFLKMKDKNDKIAVFVFGDKYFINWNGMTLVVIEKEKMKKIEYKKYYYIIIYGTRLRITTKDNKKYIISSAGPSSLDFLHNMPWLLSEDDHSNYDITTNVHF